MNSKRCGTSASRSFGPMSGSSDIIANVRSMTSTNSSAEANVGAHRAPPARASCGRAARLGGGLRAAACGVPRPASSAATRCSRSATVCCERAQLVAGRRAQVVEDLAHAAGRLGELVDDVLRALAALLGRRGALARRSSGTPGRPRCGPRRRGRRGLVLLSLSLLGHRPAESMVPRRAARPIHLQPTAPLADARAAARRPGPRAAARPGAARRAEDVQPPPRAVGLHGRGGATASC